jgi:hypothetical protein
MRITRAAPGRDRPRDAEYDDLAYVLCRTEGEYARVPTDNHNFGLQRDALGKAGCGEIYQEKTSGKNA